MTTQYTICRHRSFVQVRTPSTLHTVESIGYGLSGELTGDIDAVANTVGGTVSFSLGAMTFGNKVQDWALHKHLNVKEWQFAVFEVEHAEQLQKSPWSIKLKGQLNYRQHRVSLTINATGQLTEMDLNANSTFELDLHQIGIKPPQFLFLKASNIVEVTVQLYASRSE